MFESSLKQLGDALRAKKISSVELTQLYLDRISRLNPALNAYITLNPEISLAQARAADARLATGQADALAALREAHRVGDPFEFALLDYQMPGLDGLGLAREV